MNIKESDIEEQVTKVAIREFIEDERQENKYGVLWKDREFVIHDEYNDIIWIKPGFKDQSRATKGHCEYLADIERTYELRMERIGKYIGGFDY